IFDGGDVVERIEGASRRPVERVGRSEFIPPRIERRYGLVAHRIRYRDEIASRAVFELGDGLQSRALGSGDPDNVATVVLFDRLATVGERRGRGGSRVAEGRRAAQGVCLGGDSTRRVVD